MTSHSHTRLIVVLVAVGVFGGAHLARADVITGAGPGGGPLTKGEKTQQQNTAATNQAKNAAKPGGATQNQTGTPGDVQAPEQKPAALLVPAVQKIREAR